MIMDNDSDKIIYYNLQIYTSEESGVLWRWPEEPNFADTIQLS